MSIAELQQGRDQPVGWGFFLELVALQQFGALRPPHAVLAVENIGSATGSILKRAACFDPAGALLAVVAMAGDAHHRIAGRLKLDASA
jgi:hypothetical protein